MITAVNIGLNGILTGTVYGLMALSLSVIFGVTRIVNFAHGEILVLSALTSIVAHHFFGIHPFSISPILALILFLGCYALQYTLIHSLLKTSEYSQFIALSAIAIILVNFQLFVFGSDSQSVLTASSLRSISLGPFLIDYMRLWSSVISLLTVMLLYMFFHFTSQGKSIRACADNRFAAKIIGLNDRHLYALSFGIAGIVLAISGSLMSTLMDISPQLSPQLTLLSFTIVIIGGLGSQMGSLLGGILVGVIESYTAFYSQSSLKSLVSFILLILVLLVRPHGLMGQRS